MIFYKLHVPFFRRMDNLRSKNLLSVDKSLFSNNPCYEIHFGDTPIKFIHCCFLEAKQTALFYCLQCLVTRCLCYKAMITACKKVFFKQKYGNLFTFWIMAKEPHNPFHNKINGALRFAQCG